MAQWIVVAIGLTLMVLGGWGGQVLKDTMGMRRDAKIRRIVGLVLVVLGGFIAAGAFFEPPPLKDGEGLPWETEAKIEAALAEAKAENRPVLIDFWTVTCTNCKVLERETLMSPGVAQTLKEDFTLLKVNTDVLYEKHKPIYDAFKAKYGNIDSQPFVVFHNGAGEYLPGLSFHGLKGPEEVSELLPRVRDASPEAKADEGSIADQIKQDGLLWVLLLVFAAGVGASLTPCVYPLIPITISVFGARDADSRLQAFGLSSVYVLGIVLTYTVLGLVAGLAGKGIGEAMKNPLVLAGIAALMIAMGLSSFGLFELQLPSSLQNKLSAQGGKGIVGALVMGLVAGLVATPCVGPILVAILVFVAQTQDMVLGAVMLATFALGMGMLFLVLGTFANLINKLPRSGTWMVGVKTVFGVIFMVVALYYLRLALPFLKAPVLFAWQAAQAITG